MSVYVTCENAGQIQESVNVARAIMCLLMFTSVPLILMFNGNWTFRQAIFPKPPGKTLRAF